MPDRSLRVLNRKMVGDELVVEWEATGTHANSFLGFGGKGHTYTLRGVTTVVRRDGKILARQITLYVDSGAYSRHSPYGTTKAAAHMPGPYTIPHVRVDAHCVYTNRQPSSAMRGFGVTLGDFAIESQMDVVANALGIDPLRLRLLNAYRDGDMKAHRKLVEGAALVEVIQKTAELAGQKLDPDLAAMSSDGG